MRGKRLARAIHIAEKVFKKYEGFNPRNLKQSGHFYRSRLSDDEIKRLVGMYRKTKIFYSCNTCSPRKYWGYLSVGEIRQHLDADLQYDELGLHHRKRKLLIGWLD